MNATPKKLLVTLAGALLLGGSLEPAMAAVTTLAWYRGGEADSGATAGGAIPAMNDSISDPDPTYKIMDSSVNDQYIVGGGDTQWTSDVPSAGELPLGASTLAYKFTGNGMLYRTKNQLTTTLNDSVGIECWVKSSVANQAGGAVIAYNGTFGSGSSGFGLVQIGATYYGDLEGLGTVGSTPVSTSEWTHLALVMSGGVTTFYVNGVFNASVGTVANPVLPLTPTGVFTFGGSPYATPPYYFSGNVDETRVFSFAPGQFSVNDLNIPEPAAVSLLGLAMLGLWRRRA